MVNPQTIQGSIAQINGTIEVMARGIHKNDGSAVRDNLADIEEKIKFLAEHYPELEKDRHFKHLILATEEFRRAFDEMILRKSDLFSLEAHAAKMLAASRDVHGPRPSPFAVFSRLFG